MALIEKIEIDAIKQAVRSPYLYLTLATFLSTLLFTDSYISIYYLAVLALVLSFILVIDIKHYIIPDSAQISLFLLANLLMYLSPEKSFLEGYAGFAFAILIFYGIYYISDVVLGKEALGFGDVKLFANVGLILGFFSFNYFLWVLTITSGLFLIFKLVFKKKNKLIPYGPFIVVSAWICLLYSDTFKVFHNNIMDTIVSSIS